MDITCDGVIIRETAYGESDKIVTFLTAEYGRISVMAKGVKTITSKNSHAVQLFCYSTFEMTEKNGRYTLKTGTAKDTFYAVRDNIERFALASYFADIASTVCTENNDEREMLRLILNSFYAMSHFSEVPLWKIKTAFEIKCMDINGMAPDFSACCDCGKSVSACADKQGMLLFSIGDGAVLCDVCKNNHEENSCLPISCDTVAIIDFISSAEQADMLKFSVADEASVKELCLASEKYLSYHTARRYDTLSFYKTVCAM